ncbi:replication termination factor 2-like [Dysidea avara]|uniref:replication termination factor 2-like n=1 Tax=Dysidea avara TaxID=196820 RepID=UPI003333BC14
MGCDGGTIPRRDELVKLKKKAEKASKDSELDAKWRYCALSAERLRPPIVCCELGRLFNKEALLLALLDKSNLPDLAKHIRSLKDVRELSLTANPSHKEQRNADTCTDTAPYICPVTGLEMSGRYRFSYLRTCGCVVSERALKEAPSESCYKCGKPFAADDVVPINGTEDDVKTLREKMTEKRQMAKASKKKRKTAESDASTSSSSPETKEDSGPVAKKAKLEPKANPTKSSTRLPTGPSSSSNIRQFDLRVTAMGAAKAAGDHDDTSNPTCRDVFKSLFTSRQEEQAKDKTSKWITCDSYK